MCPRPGRSSPPTRTEAAAKVTTAPRLGAGILRGVYAVAGRANLSTRERNNNALVDVVAHRRPKIGRARLSPHAAAREAGNPADEAARQPARSRARLLAG